MRYGVAMTLEEVYQIQDKARYRQDDYTSEHLSYLRIHLEKWQKYKDQSKKAEAWRRVEEEARKIEKWQKSLPADWKP
jgi:hypothetical protein